MRLGRKASAQSADTVVLGCRVGCLSAECASACHRVKGERRLESATGLHETMLCTWQNRQAAKASKEQHGPTARCVTTKRFNHFNTASHSGGRTVHALKVPHLESGTRSGSHSNTACIQVFSSATAQSFNNKSNPLQCKDSILVHVQAFRGVHVRATRSLGQLLAQQCRTHRPRV